MASALLIAEQIALALDYAHAQPVTAAAGGTLSTLGVIHAALKPNIHEDKLWSQPSSSVYHFICAGLDSDHRVSHCAEASCQIKSNDRLVLRYENGYPPRHAFEVPSKLNNHGPQTTILAGRIQCRFERLNRLRDSISNVRILSL